MGRLALCPDALQWACGRFKIICWPSRGKFVVALATTGFHRRLHADPNAGPPFGSTSVCRRTQLSAARQTVPSCALVRTVSPALAPGDDPREPPRCWLTARVDYGLARK